MRADKGLGVVLFCCGIGILRTKGQKRERKTHTHTKKKRGGGLNLHLELHKGSQGGTAGVNQAFGVVMVVGGQKPSSYGIVRLLMDLLLSKITGSGGTVGVGAPNAVPLCSVNPIPFVVG